MWNDDKFGYSFFTVSTNGPHREERKQNLNFVSVLFINVQVGAPLLSFNTNHKN